MKIGTEVSIAECRRSGYMVMEFKKRDLIKKGVLDKDCEVTLSVSFPESWNDAGKPMIGFDWWSLWSLEPIRYTFNDLMEILDNPEYLEQVESCCDWKNCKPNLETPTEYDLLHLASDIHNVRGIE